MTTFWKHQQEAFDFIEPKTAALVAMGMGCGKSFVAVSFIDHLKCSRVIILCPPTVRGVWRREFAKHSTRNAKVVILENGNVKKRTKQAREACKCGGPVVVVINYEAAWREPFRSWALAREWDLALLDESQRAQYESKTALFCNALRGVSKRRLCLTGTPLTQDAMSVWAQCRFLDPSVFGENVEWFKDRYHNQYAVRERKELAKLQAIRKMVGKPPINPLPLCLGGTINTDEYMERLGRIAFRVENAVLDLPPLIVEERTFTLSNSARKIYNTVKYGHDEEIESGLWRSLKESYSTVMRCQQITSGWLEDRTGTILPIDDGKADCLRDILTEASGEPVVVCCRFLRDLDIVREATEGMGLRYGEISGRLKDGLSDMGTMSDDIDVVGVQERAGGAGIDLTRARIAVCFSISWSLADYDQFVARIHRPPASRPVILYQLVAEGTIDEDLYRALTVRREMVSDVWRELEKRDQTPSSNASCTAS